MPKLYFRHGAVSSAKTMNLLAVAHQYERHGKRVLVAKPAIDTRDGERSVVSRAGLEREADLTLARDARLDPETFRGVACVLVDEAQFLSPAVVEQLRELTHTADVPVIAYGLRTDFRGRLFEGSRRLMEIADTIEEIKTTCAECNRKAVFNLRFVDGRAITDGPAVQLGGDELYRGVCYEHYRLHMGPAGSA
jgi:thymidine kinase